MLLRLENIEKSYKNNFEEKNVLNGISLKIRDNDIVTIYGNSGVGKSTLLNIVSGIINPDKGIVNFNGKIVDNSNKLSIRKKMISILLQKDNLLPEFNVSDNMILPLIINGFKYMEAESRVNEVLDYLDMKNYKLRYPNHLSSGEYQRISLLRCICKKPKLIIADEPTANLDEKNCEQLMKLIVKLNKDYGMAFLIASHDKRFKKVSTLEYELFNGDLKINE
ncbi:MAG: lipoprotein-releasing system ATP-binding protein LolD [Candidatus Marinimicrobia bacterium]|nr:lipoprotein-releasing system ATP-binding protein LolD [Candidatus Neomarinimicrobiota bacterium]